MKITKDMIVESKALGSKIFNLQLSVHVIRDEKFFCGMYDHLNDDIKINEIFLNRVSDEFIIPLLDIVKHTICHEFAHAKEARYCAESDVFPFTIRVNKDGYFILGGRTYSSWKFQEKFSFFLNTITDTYIDKILLDNSLIDHTSKFQEKLIEADIKKEIDYNDILTKFNVIFNVPLYINNYMNGGFKNREIIKKHVIDGVGEDIWIETYDACNSYIFGDITKFKDLYVNILSKLFQIKSSWNIMPRKFIKNDLPSFWNSEEYEILHIQ